MKRKPPVKTGKAERPVPRHRKNAGPRPQSPAGPARQRTVAPAALSRPADGLLVANPWQELRRFTSARIALGRAGPSLPTQAVLDFGLAHAQARDAVHQPLDAAALEVAVRALGREPVRVHSAAPDRAAYLRRPDWGRRLDEASRERIAALAQDNARAQVGVRPPDAVFVIADGLSARAAMAHAIPVLRAVLPQMEGWTVAPVFVAEQTRVALGDEIGELLGAALSVMLIGERPGLSSPDSLGVYVTHQPHPGRTDAERNCISNVRPGGLGYAEAAHKLAYLMHTARRLGYSGLRLKDESGSPPQIPPHVDPG